MINKIENYLNEKKNLILFYSLSIFLLGLIYYSFNYSVLGEKIEEYNYKIELLEKKIKDDKSLYFRLKQLEKRVKTLESKNLSLKEDIKYINVSIKSSDIFHINEKRFFIILKDVLQKAIDNNIKASYKIEVKKDKFKIYSIYIDGDFNKIYFFNFFNFIKELESIKNIKKIQNLLLTQKDNSINFSLVINFWSIL